MDFIELLQNPAYRHMLTNHIPIIGLFTAWLVLIAGLAARQAALQFAGLVLVALTAGTSVPVVQYGDAAYPAIYDALDGHGRDWLDYHAELAETWAPLLYVNAGLALAALSVGAVRRGWLKWASAMVAVVTLAAVAGASLVAQSGGKIQHPEFRLGEPPVAASPQ